MYFFITNVVSNTQKTRLDPESGSPLTLITVQDDTSSKNFFFLISFYFPNRPIETNTTRRVIPRTQSVIQRLSNTMIST